MKLAVGYAWVYPSDWAYGMAAKVFPIGLGNGPCRFDHVGPLIKTDRAGLGAERP